MLGSSLLLLTLFVFPMWNISLEAPQYPDAIGMDIYVNALKDANPNDIKNINIMNHYVGMKPIPEKIPEFELFPKVIYAMLALGLIFTFIGNPKLYLLWGILLTGLCFAGIYDFYLWEYDYGHTLSENAAIKFTNEDGSPLAYQPPLIGTKTILNFVAHSYPRISTLFLVVSIIASTWAGYKGIKKS